MRDGFHKSGDWQAVRRVFKTAGQTLKGSFLTALRREGQVLRRDMVRGITRQAPGGDSFAPLSPWTLETRRLRRFGGTKALIVNADLRNGIGVVPQDDGVFVGVPRKARAKDGSSLVDVAQVHEFGKSPIIIKKTPAMRRFLAMLARRLGEPRSGAPSSDVVVVTVPPRPFVRPAFKVWSVQAEARLFAHLKRHLGGNP